MAKIALKKIRVTGFKKHYKVLMQELQKSGVLQVTENKDLVDSGLKTQSDHYGVFDLSKIDFAINFLDPYASKKSKLDTLLSGGRIILSEKEAKTQTQKFAPQLESVVERCSFINERLVRIANELAQTPVKLKLLDVLSKFGPTLQKEYGTDQTTTFIGSVTVPNFAAFQSNLAQETNLIDLKVLSKTKEAIFVQLTVWNELMNDITPVMQKYNFEKLDMVSQFPEFLGKEVKTIKRELSKQDKVLAEESVTLKAEARELSKNIDDLKVTYDSHAWGKEKNEKQGDMYVSDNLFMFEGWVVADALKDLDKWIERVFLGDVSIDEIDLAEGEEQPVKFQNKWGIRFFEPVVEMYGLPKAKEIDPTPVIAPFFFVFFGLCLSDVGYGSILLILSLSLLLFGRFSQAARDGLWLLLFCGVSAFIGGIILGGYFGMTPEQLPVLVNPETGEFYGQLINPMVGSGPIIFLSVALGIGFIQLLFGLIVGMVQALMNKEYLVAFCDKLGWFVFLLFIALWALADMIGVDKSLMGNILLAATAFLVLTQGRDQKSWVMKPVMGVLSLYDITAYLSDLLSYSRIMALGLATGVVGFAMNLTAGILGGMMPHWTLGIVISVIVILFGHSLNFGLSLLGAFIHSGRLQFIEFFGRFYEGGGVAFKPFERESRYVFIQDEKS